MTGKKEIKVKVAPKTLADCRFGDTVIVNNNGKIMVGRFIYHIDGGPGYNATCGVFTEPNLVQQYNATSVSVPSKEGKEKMLPTILKQKKTLLDQLSSLESIEKEMNEGQG